MKDNSISLKNTKNEILEAYTKLIKEQEKEVKKDRLEEREEKIKIEKVQEACKNDKKGIINKIAELKIEINSALDILSKNLIEEKGRFDEIQEARKIESEKLKELYNIESNAKTLEALLLAQSKQEEEFRKKMEGQKLEIDKEILLKKEQWEKEQEEYELKKLEREKLLKIEKERENEEYKYQIKIRNQKDKDEYEQKKLQLERELKLKQKQSEDDIEKRLINIKSQEEELNKLRKIKENYDKEIKLAVETTKANIEKELETRYKYESQLKEKDKNSTIELLKQTIESLKEKLSEKDGAMQSMQKQVSTAHLQSQELAKKVVEGVASSASIKNLITSEKFEKKENK